MIETQLMPSKNTNAEVKVKDNTLESEFGVDSAAQLLP